MEEQEENGEYRGCSGKFAAANRHEEVNTGNVLVVSGKR